ncbi:MAG: hypothetical protein ABR555_05865 [Pyrinomonadaceae bacterium]
MMTSLTVKRDHNIYGSCAATFEELTSDDPALRRVSEAGYTLVALLALMTLLALFAMAAAPSVRQQTQREREREAMFRGEQVADAIRDYYLYRSSTLGVTGDQALPTSMDQLLEGIPIPGGSKKRQVLRVSAAHDPLTTDGDWRLIRPRSQALIDFQRSVLIYTSNFLPQPKSPKLAQLQQFAVPLIANVLNTGTTDNTSADAGIDEDSDGPFVGVASKSKNDAVLYYYGIDHQAQWIFTPLFRN